MRPATASRASRSRAASTTWAPAAAIASAVAAPIPRLAPVTTARPPGQPMPRLSHGPRPRHRRTDAPVELLVSVEAQLEIEVAFGMIAAAERESSGRPPDGVRRRLDVVGRDQEAGHRVDDHLAECAATEGDDRSAARLRLGGDHAERLLPPCRAQDDGCARHRFPEWRSRNTPDGPHARIGASRIDPLPRVLGVIGVAVDIDRGTPAARAMSIASIAPFSGLSRPAKTAPSPPIGEQRISSRRDATAAGSRRRPRRGARRSPGTRTRRQPSGAGRSHALLVARRRQPRQEAGGAYARPARAGSWRG